MRSATRRLADSRFKRNVERLTEVNLIGRSDYVPPVFRYLQGAGNLYLEDDLRTRTISQAPVEILTNRKVLIVAGRARNELKAVRGRGDFRDSGGVFNAREFAGIQVDRNDGEE